MKYFTKKHLLEQLRIAHNNSKAQGGPDIPHTYKTLLVYEKMGFLERKSDVEMGGTSNWRLYTEQDIQDIVKKFIDYKNKGGE